MNLLSNYWRCSTNDLYELYQKHKFDELYEYYNENRERIFDLWNNENVVNTTTMRKVLKYGMSVLEYFGTAFENAPELDIVFKMGELLGKLESLDKISHQIHLNEKADCSYCQELKKVELLDEIVKTLKIKGPMSHTELCEYLHLRESILSQIIKNANPLNLIGCTQLGKFKYYRLTDYGRRVASKIRIEEDR